MLLVDMYNKYKYNVKADRIGPDVPFTHWKLYYKKSMLLLCKNKFKKFAHDADFRPGAYAVGCSQIEIGHRVIIRPACMLFAESVEDIGTTITIEDDVMLGCGVHIYTNNHKFDDKQISLIDQGYYPSEQVKLKKGCWIGANAIILPGVQIGENAVVGAGSVVTKSIPAYSVAVGCPAKVIKLL